jgi:polyhydroxybutyrate depolymerase
MSPGQVMSAKDSAAHFRSLAGITEPADIEHVPDLDAADGTQVVKYRWDGARGVEIVLMAVEGGGHSLPGADVRFPEPIVGQTSRDLNGAQAVWEFCERRLQAKPMPSQSHATGYADVRR